MCLIAIEGIDGVGKTTIALHLRKFLSNLSYDCVVLKEPSESVYGEKIRSSEQRLSAEEELQLFILDREIDVKERILPALRSGKIVIMDRYYYSNIAYQSCRGIDAEKIREMNEKFAPKPDLVIILDVSVDVALQRIKNRKKLTAFEEKEYLEKVRQRFLEIADDRTVIVNAGDELEKVKKKVEEVVLNFLRKKGYKN
ncbi:MAG: dTMP kinase [Archaeoglobaceae archaeon]